MATGCSHDDLRLKIVTLFEHTSKSQREIADDLQVSQSMVSKVIKDFKKRGTHLTNYGNCGGHNKHFNDRDLRRIKTLSKKNPRADAAEIQRHLSPSGDCSVRTMQRALVRLNIKAVKPYRRPFLSQDHAAKRLEWARSHRNWTTEEWRNVIFSDETIIRIQDNCPLYVRVIDGEPLTPSHYNLSRKHPTQVQFWACFSYHGTGRASVVEGNMNSAAYIEKILDGRLIHQLQEWYPNGEGIFMQDNAPCHKSKVVMQHFARQHIQVLPWPACSPDLNPIENLWSIVKRRVKVLEPKTKNDLITGFIHVWNRDDEIQQMCQNLVDSMPDRIEAVIAANGWQTRY